jgi:hypothetical protein
VRYQRRMNFKILSITIVVAASLAALAATPLTTTPAYAGGNVKTDQKTHVHHASDVDVDQNQECIGQEVTGSCNTTTNNPPGGGNEDNLKKCGTPGALPPPNCKP